MEDTTMKKTYITPAMETVKITIPNLLTLSSTGDEYNSNDVSYSRSSGGWDED
jgi:hypothetical protein